MPTQAAFWTGAGAALAVAVFAGVMDVVRRKRRRAFDDIGWVPWRGIQAMGFFAAAACAMLALGV